MNDISYLLILQHLRQLSGGIFDSLMLHLTSLGEGTVTFMFLALVYWCVDKRAGQVMGLNVSLACTWNQFLKNVFKIERPWVRDDRIKPVEAALSGAGGYSFPSGHTQRAMAVWGTAGYVAWKKVREFAWLCFGIVLLVAFSRNYLGVHTPQDVLFALGMGVAGILLVDQVLKWADKGDYRDFPAAGMGCLLCFLPMLRVGCLSNAGAGMGFWVGWVLERRWVKFEADGTRKEKVVRFAVGALGALVIQTALSSLLTQWMAVKYAGFFSGFVLTVFIMAVYPFFFSRKSRHRAGVILAVLAMLVLGILGVLTQRFKATQRAEGQDSRQWEQPVIIAHRGYSGVYPENTLVAFAGAVDIGADMVELDVQLSSDGIVVVLHDDSLERTAGQAGTPADYTYEELSRMDAGSWFDQQFSGESIPSLAEVLGLLQDSGLGVYLELKDIGAAPGFEEAVLAVTEEYGMTGRCIFASFRYEYLQYFKKHGCRTLLNISEYDASLPEQYEADYYGLYQEKVTGEIVSAIHKAGRKAYVWTVDTPDAASAVLNAGVDGIVTNQPGRMKVLTHKEYAYLREHFVNSFALPGLYGAELPEVLGQVVVQGMSKVKDQLVITAYSKAEGENSILYVLDSGGSLQEIVDLGFCAHVGGTAYDETHDLLWVTGPEGNVYALSWSQLTSGEVLYSFQAGLLNHGAAPVASFLDVFDGKLYVGSYCDGQNGRLNCYDITDPSSPVLLKALEIPERIQGVTFRKDDGGNTRMLLSQGYQTEDSSLLIFNYDEGAQKFDESIEQYTLPEGAEQIEWTDEGLYLLFESAARPYRETARVVNDQVWLVN